MSRPGLASDGPLLLARYAYPPNELGYCGGDDHRALLEQTSSAVVDGGLRQALKAFEGAWPYLELIAAANGLDDPRGALPHHSFHVLGVYPFVGLLRNGVATEPLHVLDRCRIRWGRVVAVTGDHAVVQSQPLEWDGHHLVLGAVREEVAVTGDGTLHLTSALAPGDWCSLHWDWVCDRLEPAQVRALRHYSRTQLAAVNDAPATVLA